ncbi:MAG: class I SAM-dependent methyltransferase [Pseudomonadota bacterium]
MTEPKTSGQAVAAYYDSLCQEEWRRLERHWLEFAVTRHFLKRFLPPEASILDIGGGPGRYALDLTESGHRVDLLDLSPGNIELAGEQARERDLVLNSLSVGDARDLSGYQDSHYDAVLLLGPLYHLVEAGERARAVKEALRVLKPGGVAFFAFISRYAAFHFNTKMFPEQIGEKEDLTRRIFESGLYRPEGKETFFIESHFADPEDIDPFMRQFPLQKLSLFGAEGLFAQSELALAKQKPDVLDTWLDLAIDYAETKGALYNSEHLVFVGKKR